MLIDSKDSPPINKEKIYIDFQHMRSDLKGFITCPYPWKGFYITWDGFLVPCCAKPFPKEKNFGNVFKKGLLNCLNDKDFIEFRAMAKKNITPDFCKRCHFIV